MLDKSGICSDVLLGFCERSTNNLFKTLTEKNGMRTKNKIDLKIESPQFYQLQ